jgi:hypothetical protein
MVKCNRTMWEDPIVAEIRKIREEHAARFNYDLWAIYEDLKEQERKSGREFKSYPPRRIPPKKRATDEPPSEPPGEEQAAASGTPAVD